MKQGEYRSFTIQGSDIGFSGGSYKVKHGKDGKGGAPSSAAKKAASALFRVVRNAVKYQKDPKGNARFAKLAKFAKWSKEKSIKFLLRETTRGSGKESFYYEATVVELKDPITVNRNGVEVVIKHKVSVKVCHDPHNHH
jgi:CxxC motif-containing protein (DUF1111 family)